MKSALLLLPLLLASQPASQEPPEPAPEARFLKHLLHLTDGRILRHKARPTEGGWEVQEKGGATRVLAQAALTRIVRERDVLAEARRLERKVDDTQPVSRVAFSEWMFSQGLVEEGVEELDRVLARHPDQPAALKLIRRERPPLALPALAGDAKTLTSFLRGVAGARPVAREEAILRLGELHGTLDLRATLRHELSMSSVRRRAFAALALQRLFPGEEIKSLLHRAVLDGSGDVRAEAGRALGAAGEPAVILPLLRALGSRSPAVRRNAAESLGHAGYAQAVEPLYGHLLAVTAGTAQSGAGSAPPRSHIFVGKQLAYVQDYDVEVAQGAAIADPVINTLTEGSVLDVRILSVSQSGISSEKAVTRRSLKRLTGADPGNTTDAWKRWWAENGDGWKAVAQAPDSPAAPETPDR